MQSRGAQDVSVNTWQMRLVVLSPLRVFLPIND